MNSYRSLSEARDLVADLARLDERAAGVAAWWRYDRIA
jgi:hypothetical protein